MASIKLSGLISDIRGKLNGSYFAKRKNVTVMSTNRGGKLTKADAGRGALQTAQLAVGRVSQSWAGVTESVKNQWSAFASTKTWFSKTGEPYTPSGYEVYTQTMLNHCSDGSNPYNYFPTIGTQGFIDDCYFELANGNELRALISEQVTYDKSLLVFCSGPNSKGTLNPYGGLKKLGLLSPNWSLPYVLCNSAYIAIYGAFPYNSRIFYRIDLLDQASGILWGSKSGFIDIGAEPPPLIPID
jgi:hypothetical protein